MDLREADILGDAISGHWYYRSKAKAMVRLLGSRHFRRILDVGAGSGFFSRHLLSNSIADEAWCVDVCYDGDAESRVGNKPIHFRRRIESVNADLILLMDVLEHVDDDVALLSGSTKDAHEEALFLISVPAFSFLWSSHDVFLGHLRRYTLKDIEAVVRQAGLAPIRGGYYFAALLPIAGSIRLAEKIIRPKFRSPKSQLQQHHPAINKALEFVSEAELGVFPHNRVAGLTAFCLAKLV